MIHTNPDYPGLGFDDEAHRYAFRGEPIPSVSQIIRFMRLPEFDFVQRNEAAMLRGTHVHEATHLFDEGRLDWTTVNDEVAPYLAAWMNFCAEHGYQPFCGEQIVCNDAPLYGGKYDTVGLMRGHEYPALIDRKTCLQPHTCKWWELQLEGYAACMREPVNVMNVILMPDGQFRIAPRIMGRSNAHKHFMNLARLWWAMKG